MPNEKVIDQDVETDALLKSIRENGPGRIMVGPPSRMEYIPSSAEGVLREWVAFLQAQLKDKVTWYELALKEEKERVEAVATKCNELANGNGALVQEVAELRVALGEVVQLVWTNETKTDDNDWKRWNDLLHPGE